MDASLAGTGPDCGQGKKKWSTQTPKLKSSTGNRKTETQITHRAGWRLAPPYHPTSRLPLMSKILSAGSSADTVGGAPPPVSPAGTLSEPSSYVEGREKKKEEEKKGGHARRKHTHPCASAHKIKDHCGQENYARQEKGGNE
jgi:hypothetical protein